MLVQFKFQDTWFNRKDKDMTTKKEYQFSKIVHFEYNGKSRSVGVIEENGRGVITGYVLNDPARPIKSFAPSKIVYRSLGR